MPDSVKDSYQIRSIYAYENYDFIEGLTTNMTFSEVKECVGEKVSLDDPIGFHTRWIYIFIYMGG